jgi:hypothetical protein
MANQGFVQAQNLLEVPDGAELIQNLAGGTVDADMRLFAGLSSKRSQLFWDRFYNTVSVEKSPSTLTQATQFQWQTDYTYTDEDTVSVTPINLIKDIAASFIGFDGDGALVNNLSGNYIAYDRGEGYTPGTYNLNLQGGTGQNATAEIIVDQNGSVSSVEITNSGSGYALGDTFAAAIPGNGVGFNVRIIANPWKVTIVGNFAWDISNLSNKQLSVKIVNTSASLDGDYNIRIPDTGVNAWHLPNNSSSPAYDINRKIYADTKIANNLELYDIDGDGTFTSTDVELFGVWSSAKIAGDSGESAINTWLNSNTLPSGAIRNNTTRIFTYLEGLDPSLWDVDGTGFNVYTNTSLGILNRITGYFSSYVSGGNYTFPNASILVSQTPTATTSTTKHAIAIDFLAERDPQYTVPAGLVEEYERPYFSLHYLDSNSKVNAFDNFIEYGSQQTCTTSQSDWINNVQVGAFNSTYNYRIVDKFSVTDTNQNIIYYVTIVTPGSGRTVGVSFGSAPALTPINAAPVFNSASEYGVYDSNSSNNFFLRTNPRSVSETAKNIVTFSELYQISDSNSTYNGQNVDVTTLIPDIILQRDDSLTTENIENLESPVIVDDGQNDFVGTEGSFSYNIDGYSEELENVINNVDESIYLRSTKYRIDRNLYYLKEIVVNGFMSSFDPDGYNLSATVLTDDISPGIYISSSASQITNPLASDFANKTRSFSSDYNPWKDNAVANALSTTSLAVNINDLVWTSEIKLDVGTYLAHSGLSETLDDNFNTTTVSNSQSFKLKMLINGEEYFIIMRKS